jgi:hypothetical protein
LKKLWDKRNNAAQPKKDENLSHPDQNQAKGRWDIFRLPFLGKPVVFGESLSSIVNIFPFLSSREGSTTEELQPVIERDKEIVELQDIAEDERIMKVYRAISEASEDEKYDRFLAALGSFSLLCSTLH